LCRVGDVADELALGVDEVARAVEVVVAELLDADPVDRADEVLVGHGRRRLLELPQVRQARGLVADGLNTICAPFRPSARQPSGKCRS
jgi:hypothetical protein